MNAITIFLILKSLDVIIELAKKEKIPEKVLHQILEKINCLESILFK